MAANRAHNIESHAKRLARLQSDPVEAIETLLTSLDNYFNDEIRITRDHRQTSLLFLGIHSVALTVGEVFFGHKPPLDVYRDFLKTFVDGETPDTRFSCVAEDIHNWRNVIAHQWLSALGHRIVYDYEGTLGCHKEDRTLTINPRIYRECYLKAFSADGKLWTYYRTLTSQQLAAIHRRILKQYTRQQ